MTLVLVLQEEGFSYSVLEENWISAHYLCLISTCTRLRIIANQGMQ